MDAASYLLHLTTTLAEGAARLPEPVRARHAVWLRAAQNADGGWSGREDGSDLYYTAFALRSLAVLDQLTPEICEQAGRFLRERRTGQAGVVDFFSLLYAAALTQLGGGPDVFADSPADWPRRVAELLESFRTADGGYGKVPAAASGSTYHTFLVGLAYQLLGAPWPQPERIVAFIGSRRREDGGFVEIAPMRRSGTNPTAAAIGTLHLLGAAVPDGVVDFLVELATDEGGLRANGRIPLADLLSSFTGAWTLHRLGALERLDAAALRDYAFGLEEESGGFRGGVWDEQADVEYTFYGISTLALITV